LNLYSDNHLVSKVCSFTFNLYRYVEGLAVPADDAEAGATMGRDACRFERRPLVSPVRVNQ
jgi:hypothetical protein